MATRRGGVGGDTWGAGCMRFDMWGVDEGVWWLVERSHDTSRSVGVENCGGDSLVRLLDVINKFSNRVCILQRDSNTEVRSRENREGG